MSEFKILLIEVSGSCVCGRDIEEMNSVQPRGFCPNMGCDREWRLDVNRGDGDNVYDVRVEEVVDKTSAACPTCGHVVEEVTDGEG